MSGDDADGADLAEMFGDGYSQGRAFRRVGSGAEFVQQHQRLGRRRAGDEIDVGDVRGERREVLLDGLVIADVGEHGIEHRQLGALGRDRDSGLRHQHQQADGLERHRLPAGVGAADDELMVGRFELDCDRHDARAARLQRALERGMAGVAEERAELTPRNSGAVQS